MIKMLTRKAGYQRLKTLQILVDILFREQACVNTLVWNGVIRPEDDITKMINKMGSWVWQPCGQGYHLH